MEKKRIVFFGNPIFASFSLDLLCKEEDVVGVVSTKGSNIAAYARKNNLNYLEYSDPDLKEKLKNLEADLFVVVAFKILPEEIYDMPKFGSINLHPSLLPKYRGAAPINWAIINGEEKTGVTIFKLTSLVDSGLILKQEEVDILPGETSQSLQDRLMKIGGDLLLDVVKNIENLEGKEQVGEVTKAPKLCNENRRIDWTKTAKEIVQHVRGLYLFPGALAELEGRGEVKILSVSPTNIPSDKPGKVLIKDKTLLIGTSDYYLEVRSLQLPGKKIITGLDYINGYLKNGMF